MKTEQDQVALRPRGLRSDEADRNTGDGRLGDVDSIAALLARSEIVFKLVEKGATRQKIGQGLQLYLWPLSPFCECGAAFRAKRLGRRRTGLSDRQARGSQNGCADRHP